MVWQLPDSVLCSSFSLVLLLWLRAKAAISCLIHSEAGSPFYRSDIAGLLLAPMVTHTSNASTIHIPD
eukprot:11037593-Karenia_brevis.AAC.1